ncbi:MAG TPA: site-2 protease family protein [Coriobacteriia bacterium]|nr:site-2 protease family protein [Coriobacteriia bacterium]
MSTLIRYFVSFLFVLPAIILHEISHGYVAYLLGDPTAKSRGRLSLNPIRHIDPFGTLLLPAILLILSNGTAAFGYAKPVPINPRYFKNYRMGMFLTGIAGPSTNIALAVISGVAVRFMDPNATITSIIYTFAYINLVLVFFNLIPIPPLDGSRVLPLFLSDSAMHTYMQVERYGFGILMVLLWGVPMVLRVDPIGWYLNNTVEPLLRVIVGG